MLHGENKAYRIALLQQTGVLNDVVADTEVVVIASPTSSNARVYRRDGREFNLPEGDDVLGSLPKTLIDSDSVEWQVTLDALVNTADPAHTLPLVPSNVSFWFGWFAFHPDTLVYEDYGTE